MARSNLPSWLLYGRSLWIFKKFLVQKLINTVKQVSTRAFLLFFTLFIYLFIIIIFTFYFLFLLVDLFIFASRGQDHPSTFNQYLSYFDSFKLTGLLQ